MTAWRDVAARRTFHSAIQMAHVFHLMGGSDDEIVRDVAMLIGDPMYMHHCMQIDGWMDDDDVF